MPESSHFEQRVLVLAPTGRDASLAADVLGQAGLSCTRCQSTAALADRIVEGAGLAMLAEEALLGDSLQPLLAVLAEQPSWSDFPLLFLTTTGSEPTDASTRLLALLGAEANITILERPVRVATLLSSIRSALRARRRQYQVRSYLEERRRESEKLLQTQKLESLGVLAGGVAHDFNNLLVGILGNASLAAEALPPSSPIQRMLSDVMDASERAANLAKQLLAYAGKGRFVIRAVDLSESVREISHLVRSSIPKNVQLRLDLAEDLPCVKADAAQLQQIVMNLVINAAEAIPAGETGQVLVTTGVQDVDQNYIQQALNAVDLNPGTYVTMEVHDTGVGMDAHTISRIFDPFFTTKFTGRGLGLAATLGIVRGHGGALKVYSTPGRGTTFKILFPATAESAQSVERNEITHEQRPTRTETVLVVDDEEVVRRTAGSALKRGGFDVLFAEDGKQGIEMFAARRDEISLVLLDLTMPGIGGEEVVRQLKLIRPEVAVLLSSGYNEVEVIQRFMGKGLAGFIQKPYTAAALVATVTKILESA